MPKRNFCVVFEGYAPEQLQRMLAILKRAANGREMDAAEVERSLVELAEATGRGRENTQEAEWWQEFAQDRPSHGQLSAAFAALAEADNPLDLRGYRSEVRAALQGQISVFCGPRWQRAGRGEPRVVTLDWQDLSAEERADVRNMCHRVAAYHRSYVRRGQPQADDLDTFLIALAELFLRWTAQSIAVHDVPYTVNSRFIQFATEALAPLGWVSEVTPRALSSRWYRCVRHMRSGLPLGDMDLPDDNRG